MKPFRLVATVGALVSLSAAFVLASMPGCGSSEERAPFDPGEGGMSVTDARFGVGEPDACGLACQQAACETGKKTTVSGTVFDPAGQLPLYNVIVFVPTAPLAPIEHGASCDRCGTVASGKPLVATLTDAKGRFVLEDVPAGSDIPIVIQVGKWRRLITLPKVVACVDNPIVDQSLTRLPKNQKEGELPQIAMVTGCDAMECLLRNMGIDDAEFTNPDGPGRVHVYQATKGGKINDATPAATSLWGELPELSKYDMVILACECAVYPNAKPESARAAMREYVNAGGRLFASHYHYFWLRDGGVDLASTAEWLPDNSTIRAGTSLVDQSFPKGAALADWLVTVGASKKKGEIELGWTPVDVAGVNPATTEGWIYEPNDAGGVRSTKYLSFNTPVGAAADKQCGRVVFSDLHVSNNDDGEVFPTGCTKKELSVTEKALEFLIYDLSACVQDDEAIPGAPR